MATINGARALGIDDITGSLEVGKSADLIAVDLHSLASQPCYHPLSQLVYATNSQQVTDSWVAGRALLHKGQLTTLDANKLITQAAQWQQRISASDRQHNQD
jgi:5-methylthioadenosine/S-adenosylhomocysteine deaminase